jgi:cell wall-associated NlpC family hydrolase
MAFKIFLRVSFVACAFLAQCALADESAVQPPQAESEILRPDNGMQQIIDQALGLIGIRYRRSGDKPQAGFDCSGFVGYVFREGVGMILPRASREISKAGMPVSKDELEPGDLVFFNTMRHAFSHVGIYLGDHRFVHAPRTGESVRIDDLQGRYWAKRYNGARRMPATVASIAQQ